MFTVQGRVHSMSVTVCFQKRIPEKDQKMYSRVLGEYFEYIPSGQIRG